MNWFFHKKLQKKLNIFVKIALFGQFLDNALKIKLLRVSKCENFFLQNFKL